MTRLLFVSNGHGEIAIARRIAQEVLALGDAQCDHLSLVGSFGVADGGQNERLREVGPRRAMPSGGLLAMGNLRNIVRDLRAGLLAHTLGQLRFLRAVRGTYAAVVAVGDLFALLMALQAGARTVFVGTAKSLYVAPYGPMEERIMRRARSIYVRDEPTAARLREHGLEARAGNAIADLYEPIGDLQAPFAKTLALFPGSREEAYGDAYFLCAVVRVLAREDSAIGAALSVAPGLNDSRMAAELAADGWHVVRDAHAGEPFSLWEGGREIVRASRASLGDLFVGAIAVLGQAGTANEAAAAAGIPVIAFSRDGRGKNAWYRRRQAGLLGDALLVVDGDATQAARRVASLLGDAQQRARMGAVGRERMGPPGAAGEIARSLADLIA